MYRISIEYAWDTHGICTGYATNMLRICIYIHYNPWALYPYSLRYIVSPEPPLRYTSNSEQPAPELHLLLSKSRPLRFVHILKNTFPLNLIWGTQTILSPGPHDCICFLASPVNYVCSYFEKSVSPEPHLRYTNKLEPVAPRLHLLRSKSRPLRFVHILEISFPFNLIWGTQIILSPGPHDFFCYLASPVHYVLLIFSKIRFPWTSSEVHK
jgi:hypothetical protein